VSGQEWTVEELTAHIVAIDPSGPVLEAGAALRDLHRELVTALGVVEARVRFDRALGLALTRRDHRHGPLHAA
jgi:hypothetical protein